MEGPEIQSAEAVIDNGKFGTRTVRFETGRLAKQAAGTVAAYLDGETTLLSATTAGKSPREGLDFFPLTVDVEERSYAAGKIPGSFFRREGRPSTDAILTCRLIDRPLRPTFVSGLRNEVQVVITVLALNPQFNSWGTLVFVVTLLLAAILIARKVPGALLIAIVVGTIVAVVINAISDGTPIAGAVLPGNPFAAPDFGIIGHVSFNVFQVVGWGAGIVAHGWCAFGKRRRSVPLQAPTKKAEAHPAKAESSAPKRRPRKPRSKSSGT